MSRSEEETYSTIFTALKHPIRRKILRMLSEGAKSFSEIQEAFKIESAHLTYHLENLGDLLFKTKDGKYALSSFGEAATSMMYHVEETPKTPPRLPSLSIKWKVCFAALMVGLIFTASLYYVQCQILSQLRNDYENAMAEIETLRGLSSLTYLLGQLQRVTVHEGDITVENNDTLLIENCQFNLTGRLVIMDRAEVIIRNCKFISNWNFSEPAERIWEQPWRTRHLIIRNQAKLTVLNSELTFIGYYAVDSYLTVYDHATLNMTGSRITEPVNHIEACNNSKIWIKDTAISTFIPPKLYGYASYPMNALIISSQPQVEVQNSIIDCLYLGTSWSEANCTVTISNSKIEYFTASRDSSVANIVNSNIPGQLEIRGPKSNVRLVDARVGVLRAFRSSKVWLLKSSVRYIYRADEAKIWVIWNLPLFGQVVVPYAWIYAWTLYALPVTVFLITLIVTIAFIFIILRKGGVKIRDIQLTGTYDSLRRS